MELDKNIEQELAVLLADPEKVSSQHTAMLNELLQEYPYYQPLHLLLAKASQDTDENNGLARASLYTSGQTLHRFLFRKKTTPEISLENDQPQLTNDNPAVIGEDLQVVNDEQEVFEEISEPVSIAHMEVVHPESPADAADEDTFEEIGEVDYNNYRPFKNVPQDEVTEEQTPEEDEEPQEDALTTAENEHSAQLQEEHTEQKQSLEDDFVFESIVSTDFFAFEDNFTTTTEEAEPVKPEIAAPPFIEEHDEAAAAESENARISNYHDDKLPYTFLWWLAKTRKEHQSTFQPYAAPKKAGSQELQQQYVEHIFHIQSHLTGNEELLENAEPSKPLSRDFELIENFIKKDPQITPPNAEQIDNENKAKKSAEDHNDLVSETLANIYIEQMLYDKAIDTYEKLSLKFPEKSRYFADLIQSIEKKI